MQAVGREQCRARAVVQLCRRLAYLKFRGAVGRVVELDAGAYEQFGAAAALTCRRQGDSAAAHRPLPVMMDPCP